MQVVLPFFNNIKVTAFMLTDYRWREPDYGEPFYLYLWE